jgi:hypothetical protein
MGGEFNEGEFGGLIIGAPGLIDIFRFGRDLLCELLYVCVLLPP